MMDMLSHQDQTGQRKDFFINYVPQDVAWAEWIGWQLEQNGYSVILAQWDFLPGSNTILELHKAVLGTERTIAVFTPNYVMALRTLPDWTATYKKDAAGEERLFLPVRVVPCEAEGIVGPIQPIDLFGHDAQTAARLLLTGIKKERAKSVRPPNFPGAKPPIFGRAVEANPLFVGREHVIKVVYHTLHTTALAALTHSLESSKGSVGKTEIAREYVYRYQYDYRFILWVQDNPLDHSYQQLIESVASIMRQLEIPMNASQDLMGLLTSLRQWLEGQQDWLLVLDGIKHMTTLTQVLPYHLQGRVLITTRERSFAAIAPLIELQDRTPEEVQLSDRLSKLIDATLRSSDGTQIHVGAGVTTIGSAPDNTHVIQDSSVAPHHAVITLRNGDYALTDLEGSTGTFVNGQRLTPGIPRILKQKDSIKIGNAFWIYASDVTEVTFANASPPVGSELLDSEPDSTRAVLPRIDDPLEVVRNSHQHPLPEGWQVLRSEKTSFLDYRQLIFHVQVTLIRALLLLIFLVGGGVLLLFALAEDLNIGSFLLFLFVLCLDLLAIGYFAFMTAEAIAQTPVESITPPYEQALLILTPLGFVEYINGQEPLECVSYADVVLLQRYQDEEHGDWLKLVYQNGKEGQWSPRAYFKSPSYVTQHILDAFTRYVREQYGSTHSV